MKFTTDNNRDMIRTKYNLLKKLRPFLAPYKISRNKVISAIEQAFHDTGELSVNISQEALSLIFWRVFDCDGIPWIHPQTPRGNTLSFEILATAYAMWSDAQQIAFKRGLDGVDTAETLSRVAYIIADRIAAGNAAEIHSIRKYMFVCYTRALSRVVLKTGCVRRSCRGCKEDLSDDGAFMASLENAILCREILSVMPLKARKAITLRYAFGCSCEETAKEVGISNGAARKAVSVGFRKAFGVCMRELRDVDMDVEQRMKKRERRKQVVQQ